MKVQTIHFPAQGTVPYPNCVTHRKKLAQMLDTLLVAASGAGLAAVILLLSVIV